jgi:hypothetical protein
VKLVLAAPQTWPIDGVSIEVTPLRARPRDLDKLALTTLLRATPSTIRLVAPVYTTSSHGWPLRLQQVELLGGDVVIERRVLALYQFVDWVGVAMVSARDVAAFAVHEATLLEMLESGEPDFANDRAASLWEVWSGPQ